MLRVALGKVQHRVIAGAVSEGENRALPDLPHNGGRLAGLAAFHRIERRAEQDFLVFAHVVFVGRFIALSGGNIRHVGRDHMVKRDAETLHQRTDNLAFAGRDHPDVKVVRAQIIDYFKHGLVERLPVCHAFKAHRVGMIGKIDHVSAELLGGHADESRRDQLVLREARGIERLPLGICVVTGLLYGVPLLFGRAERGVIQDAVHRQAPVDIDGRFLTEDRPVHVKDGDAVCRLQIVGTGGVCAGSHEINEFTQGCAVRVPGGKNRGIIHGLFL